MSAFGVKADITIAAECLLMTPSGLNASKSMGGVLINFWRKQFLAVFNLFPLPPLDGGRIAVDLLPDFHLH
jgi:Zn-dependent protease